MKKFNLILICGVLMIILATGCGGNAITGEENNFDTGGNTGNTTSKKYQIAEDLEGTVAVNLTTAKYCFSSPGTLVKRASSGYKDTMNGYFVIYDQYVDLSSKNEHGIDYATIKNTDDIMDVMKPQFIANAQTVGGLVYADSYDYKITSKEKVNINGYEMTKFKGQFTLTCDFKIDYNQANFVGYGLLKDGYPIYFAVVDIPTGENRINIEEMADKIVKSFRDNDGDCYDD